MTTKRKTILATLAKSGPSILDDLVDSTGWVRKNQQDNLKAWVDEGLVERTKDDVTGLPAYKLSTKGQQWLNNNAKLSFTTPAGGGDISPAVAHCAASLASVSPGKAAAAIEPPTPDKSPAAARSDEQTALSKTVTDFCEWLGKRKNVPRPPRNLRECQDILRGLLLEVDTFIEQEKTIKQLREQAAIKDVDIAELHSCIARRSEQHASYAVMPDYPDMIIHQSIDSARTEAAETVSTDGPVHIVTIVDTAEIAVMWRSRS